ncbi:MAG: hypothetical protein HZC19_02775 [Candidatus Omnitrophica bacterium]|nr:hypothetical protein [Candidatus Omnitrophota bacterium]
MSLKIAKILLVLAVSALIIKTFLSLIYGSFDFKTRYYKFLEPALKYEYDPKIDRNKIIPR